MPSRGARLVTVAGLLATTLMLVCTTTLADGTLRETIQSRVTAIDAGQTITVGDTALASRTLLPAFYAQRKYTPAWVNPDSVTQLLAAIEVIDADGLVPADYHLETLRALRERLHSTPAYDPELLADYDLLLTDSLIRLGYHLSFGKVDPEALDSNWNMVRYIDNLDDLLLLGRAIDSGDVTQLIGKLRPQSGRYEQLRQALSKYRTYALLG
ncbi:MAG: hypothetical protein KJO66_09195, partial [Gammaproteobacteria bacterium]|nr:hypothetical protein [Gammaproteobacteria bacterium]